MKDKTKKHNVGGVGMKDKTKKHYIDWGSVWTVVITGCILGALGVLGTMVYQGAILKTQTNEATALIIIDSVAANTVAIHELMTLMEEEHFNGVNTISRSEVIQPPSNPSPLTRFVSAVTLKPLWEKSNDEDEDELYGSYVEDVVMVEPNIAEPIVVLEQKTVVDNINLKIAEKANATK